MAMSVTDIDVRSSSLPSAGKSRDKVGKKVSELFALALLFIAVIVCYLTIYGIIHHAFENSPPDGIQSVQASFPQGKPCDKDTVR